MKIRAALMVPLMLAAWSPGVHAQMATSSGSLTIMSRPAGVSFRVVGDQSIVGRTPMTLARGLNGRYRVSGNESGYESWGRDILLDGVSADTLWMTLHPKSAFMALVRSTIVPGWGQFYAEHPTRGLVFMGAAAGGGVFFGITALQYENKLDDYRKAEAAYLAATTPPQLDVTLKAWQLASEKAEDAYKLRQIALGVTGGIWLLGMIDATLGFPRVGLGPVLLSVDVRPSEASPHDAGSPSSSGSVLPGAATITLARVGF
jgi:hypothetical protein